MKTYIIKSLSKLTLVSLIALQVFGVLPNYGPVAIQEVTKPFIAQAAGKNDFFNSIKALPDCSSVSAGVVCEWKTVPFESQAEINSYTNSLGSGYDPDDNDVITYDPTVGMARVAIPAFSPTVLFHTLVESPKTSISPIDQCLKFQNLPSHIAHGEPLVIGDYPNGAFEIVLVQSNSSCPRVFGAVGQAYVTRGIGNSSPQAWSNGSPIRVAVKKVGVGNTLDVPFNTEGVNSLSAPNQGCGPACTTWYLTLDSVYDKSYLNQQKLPAGKTFSIGGSDKGMVTMQVGSGCKDAHGVTISGCDESKDITGKVNLRHGAPQGSGGGPDWKLTNGITNCSLSSCEVPTIGHDDGYRPQVGSMIMRPNTMMRWHVLIEAKYGDYDRVTLWLSDENNNSVLIHNRLMMSLGQDSAMPFYDAAKYPVPNRVSNWHLGMDISSYGDFTNTTYQDMVSWFSNLTLVRGLTRQQIETNYLPVKPVMTTSSNIAPFVSITNPAKNGINYPVGTNLIFNATASDYNGSVSKVEFLKNNVLIPGCAKVTTPYSCSLPLDTSGSFVLTARATDNNGLTSTSNPVSFTTGVTAPDSTPPTISITAPANSSTASGMVSITANASDNVGIANVQFKFNNNNLGTLVSTSPYAYSWNTTTVANGTYNITAVAKDYAGNSTTSATRTVTVNNTVVTPPTNQLPQGALDEINSSGIARGWSFDPDTSSASNPVHIYVDSPAGLGKIPIATINTNKLRTDVNTLKGITGNHGFEYAIPPSLKDGKTHTLHAYAIDNNDSTKSTLLTGSPKSFNFAASVNPPPVNPPPPPVVIPPVVNPPPPSSGGGGGSTRPTPPPSVKPTPTPVPTATRHLRGSLVNHNGTIYFLGSDVRYPFPSAAVFLSWGSRFEDVVPANSGDIAMPVGPVVEYKTSASQARHPRTTLVNHNGTIYFLGADIRYPFPSAAVFLSWGARFQDVVPANSGDIAMPIGPVVEMKK